MNADLCTFCFGFYSSTEFHFCYEFEQYCNGVNFGSADPFQMIESAFEVFSPAPVLTPQPDSVVVADSPPILSCADFLAAEDEPSTPKLVLDNSMLLIPGPWAVPDTEEVVPNLMVPNWMHVSAKSDGAEFDAPQPLEETQMAADEDEIQYVGIFIKAKKV